MVHLSGAPGGLIANYRILLLGLHGKLAWRKEGRGTQTLTALLELGRRVQEPSFIFFLLLFDLALVQIVRPFALIVQAAHEPVVLEQARQKLMTSITVLETSLEKTKTLLGVVAMCRQHMSSKELARLMCVFRYTSWGKQVSSFLLQASKVLQDIPPRFQGCVLQFNAHSEENVQMLGSHCQCLAAEDFCRQRGAGRVPEDRRTKVNIYVWRRLPRQRRRVKVSVEVRAPLWTLCPLQDEFNLFSPRAQKRDTSKARPAGLNYRGMFRKHLRDCSRCQVPRGVYVVHAECIAGVDAVARLLGYMREEIAEIFGDVGMSCKMLELLQAGQAAFDWCGLLEKPPTQTSISAFLRLCDHLRPYVSKTRWPHGAAFAQVPQTWTLQKRELARQYKLLVQRVRPLPRTPCCAVCTLFSLRAHAVLPRRLLRGLPRYVQPDLRHPCGHLTSCQGLVVNCWLFCEACARFP